MFCFVLLSHLLRMHLQRNKCTWFCVFVSSVCLSGSGWTFWKTLISSLTFMWLKWWMPLCPSSPRPSWTPAPRLSTNLPGWAARVEGVVYQSFHLDFLSHVSSLDLPFTGVPQQQTALCKGNLHLQEDGWWVGFCSVQFVCVITIEKTKHWCSLCSSVITKASVRWFQSVTKTWTHTLQKFHV